MCEVTRRNFDEIYESLSTNLKSASFISIDCEFSGLFDDFIKCTLFDSPDVRFKKLQVSSQNFSIIQFGLSTFKYESESNTYTVSTYNFYLKPLAELAGLTGLEAHQTFSFHPGSVQFLCKNNFDFNKLFYEGVNYVRLSEEGLVRAKVEEDSLVGREYYAEDIKGHCSRVASWAGGAREGSEMALDLSGEDPICVCLLHQEVRKRFRNAWTYFGEGKVVRIRKISSLERKALSEDVEESEILKREILNSLLGFSRVLKVITGLRIPIVGHNILMDLIMIYKQFYNPWPVSYKTFKKDISLLFPNVFDTKHMSFTLRESLSKKNTWNSNSLSDLYNYLKHGKGATLVIFSPLVNHTNERFVKDAHFHDAAFDSFCTGFCFLKLAHIFSLRDPRRPNSFQLTTMHPSNTWLLAAVAPMRNRLNLSRGRVDHIVLDGRDPHSSRPGLLYVHSRTSSPLDVSKFSEQVAKYALVDIKPLSKHKALIAVSNRGQVREILERFKRDKEVRVTRYSFLRHSTAGKALSAALVVSLVLTAVYLSRGWRT